MGAARYIDRVGGLAVALGVGAAPLPYSLGLGSEATNALNLSVQPGDAGTQIVGAPQLTLTLQVVGSATPYENFTSVGVINVSSMELALPTVGAAAGALPVPSESELAGVA